MKCSSPAGFADAQQHQKPLLRMLSHVQSQFSPEAIPLVLEATLRCSSYLSSVRRVLQGSTSATIRLHPAFYRDLLEVIRLSAFLPWILLKLVRGAGSAPSVLTELTELRADRSRLPHGSSLARDIDQTIRRLQVCC